MVHEHDRIWLQRAISTGARAELIQLGNDGSFVSMHVRRISPLCGVQIPVSLPATNDEGVGRHVGAGAVG